MISVRPEIGENPARDFILVKEINEFYRVPVHSLNGSSMGRNMTIFRRKITAAMLGHVPVVKQFYADFIYCERKYIRNPN